VRSSVFRTAAVGKTIAGEAEEPPEVRVLKEESPSANHRVKGRDRRRSRRGTKGDTKEMPTETRGGEG